jgi:hypothetical protein
VFFAVGVRFEWGGVGFEVAGVGFLGVERCGGLRKVAP